MFNLDDITKENNKEYYLKWPYIPDHSYRILIIGRVVLREGQKGLKPPFEY